MAHDREDFNIYDDIEFDNNNNANDEIYSTKEPYESQQPPEPTQQVTERRASPEHDSFSEEPALDYSQYKDVKDLALYISNMKWFTTDQQIEDLLHPFGRVAKIRFVEDKVNGKSRGSCFAAFEEPFNAVSAYEQLKNVKLDGNPLELRITSSSNFEQLNTHTRGRKERKEFMSSKGMDGDTIGAGRGAGSGAPPTGGQANGGNVGGGNPQGGSGFSQGPSGGGPGASFRNQEGGGFRGRGGYRGRGRGGPPFRGPPMIPDVPQMPPPMVPPEFEGPPGGFMPPGRGHRYPFPPFGMPPFATHVNPAFLNMRPDPRDPREFERDPRDFDRDFDRSRDDRDRDRDRSSDRDRDREKDRDRDRERERERERDRDRDRGRDRDRDRDRASSSGSDDRYNKRKREEEDRKRDRHRSHRD